MLCSLCDFWIWTRAQSESKRIQKSPNIQQNTSKSRYGWRNGCDQFGTKLSSQGRVEKVLRRSLLTRHPGCKAKAFKSNMSEQEWSDVAKPQFLWRLPLMCVIRYGPLVFHHACSRHATYVSLRCRCLGRNQEGSKITQRCDKSSCQNSDHDL